MKHFSLAKQIFIGLLLGIFVGWMFYQNPYIASYIQPIGDLFLRLIKMIVVPIVITSIVVAVAGSGDIKALGKIGGKTLIYFEIITTIAIVLGILIANWFKPGIGIDISELSKTDISSFVHTAEIKEQQSLIDTLLNIVPTNPFSAIVQGDMLAIIFFSVLFGIGVSAIGEKGKPVIAFFQGSADAMFHITNQIMKFAPFGVFALIGITVSKFGIGALIPLGKLVITVYIAMLFFVFIILGAVAKIVGFNIFKLCKLLKDELLLAFSTASSEAVLPKLIQKVETIGVPKHISSFVIPTGYSFNLDGSTLYQAIAAIFIAQMFNIDMTVFEQISLVLILMVTSKGIAGVPGVSFVVLLATLGVAGLPVEGLAYIAGIDRILDMGRTAVNIMGNALAAIVIAKWEGVFENKKSFS